MIGEQLVVKQRPESVARQCTEERDRTSQPADRPGSVERAAAQLGCDSAVGIDDEIDECLTTDDDHRSP